MNRLPGTNRDVDLHTALRSAREIRASGKARGRDHDRAIGRTLQSRPRVDDNVPATFGFQRLLDVLGNLLPPGARGGSK